MGGFTQRKGVGDFLEVTRLFPKIRFMWVGGMFYKNQYVHSLYNFVVRNDNIDMKNIPENMIFTVYTRDVKAALSASDIFFFPSIHETQGLAIVEAAANNRPIVTRDLPVFKEWLTHGHNCLMGICVDDFAARLGREAHKSVVKYHDINRTSRSLAGIYNELLGYHDHSCENAHR